MQSFKNRWFEDGQRKRFSKQAKRVLHVERRARWDGRQTPALPQGSDPASTEVRLHEWFSDLVKQKYATLGVELQEEKRSTLRDELDGSNRHLKSLVVVAQAKIERAAAEAASTLEAARVDVQETGTALVQFQRENFLTRPASYHHVLLPIGVGAIGLCAHTICDARFLADLLPGGLLDGAATAAMLAVPTMVMGLVGGYVGRYVLHWRHSLMLLGASVAAIMAAGVVGWCGYLGHLRELGATAALQGQDLSLLQGGVLAQMLASPFKLFDSYQSIILSFLALTAGAVAAWDGFAGISDRYPGYKRVDLRYRQALAAVDAIRAKVLNDITAIAEAAIAKMEKHRMLCERKAAKLQTLITRGCLQVARHEMRLADLDSALQDCIRLYRETNERVRPAGTAPAHFRDPIPPAGEELRGPVFDVEKERQRVRDTMAAAHQATDAAVEQVRAFRLLVLATLLGGEEEREGAGTAAAGVYV